MFGTNNAATTTQRGNEMTGSATLSGIKFSVEVECSIPREALTANNFGPLGGYHSTESRGNVCPVPPINGREWSGWKAERDSSLHCGHYSRVCVEFVGPVLQGAEGIKEIADFLAALRSIGAKVNNSCGLHINISHPDLFKVAAIRRLIRLTARHEQALWAINGSPSRENHNSRPENGDFKPCRPIKGAYKAKGYDELRALSNIQRGYSERYYTLNLQHVTNPSESESERRVEFRIAAGSVNSTKVTAFLRVFTGLVEAAIDGKGKPSWDVVKPERDNDLPDGVHALRILFTTLGWKPSAGLRSQIHSASPTGIRGIVTDATAPWAVKAKGIIAATPEEAAREAEKSAAVLMRLARKYDTAKGATFGARRRSSYAAF
jgi:hypothetical protein